MDPRIAALFRKLPLNRQAVAALLPLVGRYGAQGAVVLARGYLGPVADQVERRAAERSGGPRIVTADGAGATTPGRTGLGEGEVAILGMALTKLIYEAGELALHNPTVSPDGKLPEFKLDEHGSPPAFSVAHVVAATRLVRERAAESVARAQAEREQAEAVARPTSRARLQAARGEQYALVTRYAYAPRSSTNRFPR